MRRLLLGLIVFLSYTTWLQAEAWQPFGVRQLGFTFDIPPGFVLAQHSDQGAAFQGSRDAFLVVWGARLGKASFRAEIEHRMIEDEKAGWRLTYRRIAPGWASYSGVKNGEISLRPRNFGLRRTRRTFHNELSEIRKATI
ncbi:hypothetical protein ACVDG8_007770 [Mesorhizobium sp. ORM8.1]